MTKITKTVATDGTATYAESETSFADFIAAPLAGVLKIFSSEDSVKFYDERTVGIASLGSMAAGVFVGDRYGDSIPILGKNR